MNGQNNTWIMGKSHNYPLLTADQEIELSRKVQAGVHLLSVPDSDLSSDEIIVKRKSEKAIHKMILSNIRLVVSIVNSRYSDREISAEDLVAEGLVGLRQAAIKFDSTRGYRFSTYAYWWIRQAVTRYLYTHGRIIRLPVHVCEKVSKMKKIVRNHLIEHGVAPSKEYLAKEMRITIGSLENLIRYKQNTLSLNFLARGHDNEKETEVGDFLNSDNSIWGVSDLNPTEHVEKNDLSLAVQQALEILSFREREIIRLKLGFVDGRCWSLQAIGDRFNISRERVRQITNKAIKKIKENSSIVVNLKHYV